MITRSLIHIFMLLLILAAAVAMMVVMRMLVIIVMVVMMVFMLLLVLAAAIAMMMVMLVFFMAVGGGALCVPGGDLGVRLAVPGDFQKRRDECVDVYKRQGQIRSTNSDAIISAKCTNSATQDS